MTMGTPRNLAIGLAALVGLAACATAADAQISGQSHCGISGHTVTATVSYDPFNPSALSNQTVTLNLDRFIGADSSHATSQVDFYFTQPAGSPAYQILYQGNNVLYTETGPGGVGVGAPILVQTGSPPNGTVGTVFVGNTFNPNVTITVPPGLDLTNGLTLQFNIIYSCSGTSLASVSNGFLNQAVTMPISVLSAVQASYAGPPMAFGDVGPANSDSFPTFKAPITGPAYINLKSSGPYKVDLSSQHNYKMAWGAASPGPNDTIGYSLHFLGRDLTSANASFATMNCARAGVITTSQLSMRASLAEAGSSKTPSPNYQDTLTVTITPLDVASGAQDCAAL
jgi:hypothetical protein